MAEIRTTATDVYIETRTLETRTTLAGVLVEIGYVDIRTTGVYTLIELGYDFEKERPRMNPALFRRLRLGF